MLFRSKKIKPNEIIEVEIRKKRNAKFHAKSFALFNLVFQNQEHYKNLNHLRKYLTIKAGFYTTYTDLNGDVQFEPESISFASMDEYKFNEYYKRIIDVIVKEYKFDKQLMIDEIEQYF